MFTQLAREPDCALRIRAYEIGTLQLAHDPANIPGAPVGAEELFAKIGMKLWADGSPWVGNVFTTFPYLTNPTTAAMGLGPNHRGAMNYKPGSRQMRGSGCVVGESTQHTAGSVARAWCRGDVSDGPADVWAIDRLTSAGRCGDCNIPFCRTSNAPEPYGEALEYERQFLHRAAEIGAKAVLAPTAHRRDAIADNAVIA